MMFDILGIMRGSSQSALWYFLGCTTVVPDLFKTCHILTSLDLWFFSLRIPIILPLACLAQLASALCAERPEVAIRAAFLGVMTALGFNVWFNGDSSFKGLGIYMALLAWFHFSEYFFTEMCNPKKVKLESFLLNHSLGYNIALTGSIMEFCIERYHYPGMKDLSILIFVGFLICLFGEGLRKRAMYVCGPNFNHLVQYNLTAEPHSLITHDVYSIVQHPSYTGWFIFTIGTQIILCNPLCFVAFPFVMYLFFQQRDQEEVPALAARHGIKYQQYRDRTPRFIPHIW